MSQESKDNKLEKKCRQVKHYPKGVIKLNISPSIDDRGKYFNYCAYWRHPGILKEDKAKVCVARGCWHYQRYEPK